MNNYVWGLLILCLASSLCGQGEERSLDQAKDGLLAILVHVGQEMQKLNKDNDPSGRLLYGVLFQDIFNANGEARAVLTNLGKRCDHAIAAFYTLWSGTGLTPCTAWHLYQIHQELADFFNQTISQIAQNYGFKVELDSARRLVLYNQNGFDKQSSIRYKGVCKVVQALVRIMDKIHLNLELKFRSILTKLGYTGAILALYTCWSIISNYIETC
ncbi:MAG: hypothetical protein H6679_04860 [Epsilonproteobacteria bacterium]|nr:hypothetical protein [Campylobacterota bacterium]